MYKIIVQQSEGAGKEYPVEKRVSIGRLPKCDISLKDPGISREHARLFLEGGELYIADLNSSNGTFLNGRRISRERLVDGDVITVGNTRLLVALEWKEEREGGGLPKPEFPAAFGAVPEIVSRPGREPGSASFERGASSPGAGEIPLSPGDIKLRDEPLQFSPYKDRRKYSFFSEDLSQQSAGIRFLLTAFIALLFFGIVVVLGILSSHLFSSSPPPLSQENGKEDEAQKEKEKKPPFLPKDERSPGWKALPRGAPEQDEDEEHLKQFVNILLGESPDGTASTRKKVWPEDRIDEKPRVEEEQEILEEIEDAELIRKMEEEAPPLREGLEEDLDEDIKEANGKSAKKPQRKAAAQRPKKPDQHGKDDKYFFQRWK